MNLSFDITINKKSQIIISSSILDDISNYINKNLKKRQIILITQKKIFKLYGLELINIISKTTHKDLVNTIFIDEGESAKSYNSIKSIYLDLQKLGVDRQSVIISLGGGIVGDVSGFIASTFMRGIKLINIPTTLLSMVDSSIGGKNGINSNNGKNIIGTFYNPDAIFIYSNYLKTLNKRQLVSGLGEVIKYGVAFDKGLFKLISDNLDKIFNCTDFVFFNNLIKKCVKIKLSIIKDDMYDNNERRLLNFGHTLGHALEKYYDYSYLLHGEAVLYGILFSSILSSIRGDLNKNDFNCIVQLISRLNLPDLDQLDVNRIIENMKNDKKIINKKIYFITLDRIGKSKIVNNINNKEIEKALSIL